jgi:hypothetical protein
MPLKLQYINGNGVEFLMILLSFVGLLVCEVQKHFE